MMEGGRFRLITDIRAESLQDMLIILVGMQMDLKKLVEILFNSLHSCAVFKGPQVSMLEPCGYNIDLLTYFLQFTL
jgi:hypothetical protein